MEEKIYYTSLYDYYKNLFTLKQQSYFEDYYFNDLSLTEIGVNNDVSRNAVSKQLKEIKLKLDDYEEKLSLYKNGLKIKKLIECLDSNLKSKIEELI